MFGPDSPEYRKHDHFKIDRTAKRVNLAGNLSRFRSGIEEDGVKLMRRAFSGDVPLLAFHDLKEQSDLDEQEGLGHICAGVALALRNPRAHDLAPDTREDAADCLAFISYLMRRVESAKKLR